jgi:hypothetical protein
MASRKTVTVEATELLDPDVQFISLVKRGANRIPFRITKSEKDSMINLDLSRIFKREKPPTILAVVVNKAEVSEDVQSIIKEAGYSIDSSEVKEGCTIFKQFESLEGAVPVKLNDDLVLLVKEDDMVTGVTKAEESWAGEFYESMQCDGYYAAFGPAASYMTSTLSYALYKAESVDEAKKAASEIIGAFTDYTLGMIGAIPASAFKMGEAVAKSFSDPVDEAGEEESETSEEVSQKSEDPDAGSSEESSEVSEETGEEVSKESSEESSDPDESDDGEEEVSKSEETETSDLSVITKALGDLTEMFKELKSQSSELGDLIKSVQKENLDMKDKLDSVEVIAKSASKVVLGSDTPDDTMPMEASAKAETFEIIDTAFQPNIRKSARVGSNDSRYRRSL